MKGMIFKVGHLFNIVKHNFVICGVFSSKNVLSKLLGHFFTPVLYLQLDVKKKGYCKDFKTNRDIFFGGGDSGEELRAEAPSVCYHRIGVLLGHFLEESYADHMTTPDKIL